MIPGSALRKLSAITGLEAKKDADKCYRLDIAPSVALFAFVKDEQEACLILRQLNWQRVSRLVMDSQNWKCGVCGSIEGLSVHHKRFRSRWRRSDRPLDVPDNLVALCVTCHQKEHGIGK